MKTITEQLQANIETKHHRTVKILSKKSLGMRGYGVKFQFLDDGYIKSEVIRL